ncbi:hypothetical protein Pmar_PMAR015893, partial [Perkinsus marinus ATCC 50983]
MTIGNGLSWIPSNKGGCHLVHEGYKYSKKTPKSAPTGTTYWYCTNRDCSASLIVRADPDQDLSVVAISRGKKPHVCGGPTAAVSMVRETLRKKAAGVKAHVAMRPIFDEVVATAPKRIIEQLPPIKTCLNTMRVQRKKADPTPTAPVARDGWTIPSKYKKATIGGEEYCTLAFDSGLADPDRLICYYNPAVSKELNASCSEFHISLDGTFDYCAQ